MRAHLIDLRLQLLLHLGGRGLIVVKVLLEGGQLLFELGDPRLAAHARNVGVRCAAELEARAGPCTTRFPPGGVALAAEGRVAVRGEWAAALRRTFCARGPTCQ